VRTARRSRAANVALAAATTLVLLPALEWALRRVAPVRTRFYELDPSFIYRPRPGATQTFHYPHLAKDDVVTLSFNSRGYRGEELRPAGAARRIVVYGDSHVEARLTRLERTFPERLEARLAALRGRPLEAVNAGVSGYGPDQCLLRMEGGIRKLAADVVVLVLYAGNDWGDLVRNALFRLDGSGRLVANAWTLDEPVRRGLEGELGWRGLALTRAARRAWTLARGAWSEPSPAPGGTSERALEACRRDHLHALREPARVGELFDDHYDADLSLTPHAPSAEHKRRLMRAVVERIRSVAEEARAPLLALVIPAPHDVCRRFPGRVDASAYPEYRSSALTDALARILDELHVPFIDLYPAFKDDGDRFYFPIDHHWNAEAQDLAATLAAARIVGAGWLEAAGRSEPGGR
jgi:hypothetical protein